MNRRTIGYLIALAALLISIPRYIATFDDIDPVAVTAYGMGILLAGGAAYIFDAWADAHKRGVKHPDLLLIAVGINLVYEPIIITPYILSRLWEWKLAEVMSNSFAVFWSIVVASAPVILVGGIVYAISYQKQNRRSTDDTPTTTTVKTERKVEEEVHLSNADIERMFRLREIFPEQEFTRQDAQDKLELGISAMGATLTALVEAKKLRRLGHGRLTRYAFKNGGSDGRLE